MRAGRVCGGARGADDREYSDDDDVSWKVRRAAVNTLRSLILTRPDAVPYFYTRVAPVLVARFREREDNVRLDVLATFITLLEHTNAAGRVPAADSAAARAAVKPVAVDTYVTPFYSDEDAGLA